MVIRIGGRWQVERGKAFSYHIHRNKSWSTRGGINRTVLVGIGESVYKKRGQRGMILTQKIGIYSRTVKELCATFCATSMVDVWNSGNVNRNVNRLNLFTARVCRNFVDKSVKHTVTEKGNYWSIVDWSWKLAHHFEGHFVNKRTMWLHAWVCDKQPLLSERTLWVMGMKIVNTNRR